MITVRLKIGTDGTTQDTRDHGLVYISSDHRFAAELKEMDTTSYPEEEGEHIIPKAVDAPFDYTVKFYVNAEGTSGGTLENANAKIATFNALICPLDIETGVRSVKPVTFYNDYKKVKIVGYPKPISEATDFWRDSKGHTHDVVVVEWTIRVVKPSSCDFNFSQTTPTTQTTQTTQS